MRLLMSLPDGFSAEQYERRNMLFMMRSRSGAAIKAGLMRDMAWSQLRRILVPDRVMRYYLKRRYGIDEGGN